MQSSQFGYHQVVAVLIQQRQKVHDPQVGWMSMSRSHGIEVSVVLDVQNTARYRPQEWLRTSMGASLGLT